MAKPWERQRGEGAKAYDAFCCYRDLPPQRRTQQKVVAMRGVPPRTVANWSKKYEWTKRIEAWDDELDRQARAEHVEELKAMRKRHARLAKKMLDKMESVVDSMWEEDVKPADVGRIVEVASKLERLSMGDSGEVIEERDGGEAINPVAFYMPDNKRDQKGGASE